MQQSVLNSAKIFTEKLTQRTKPVI